MGLCSCKDNVLRGASGAMPAGEPVAYRRSVDRTEGVRMRRRRERMSERESEVAAAGGLDDAA